MASEHPAWLRDVVSRSRFLWERLAPDERAGDRGSTPTDAAVIDERLERWRRHLGQRPGEADRLGARLALAGLELDAVRPALAGRDRSIAREDPLPDWAPVLPRIARIAQALSAAQRASPPLHASQPIPFEPLLLPAVLAGRELLDERLASGASGVRARALLSDGARYSLERALLEHLATFCGKPLALELSRTLSFGEQLLNDLDVVVASSTERYDRFVDGALADGLRTIFLEYPVLARLVATSVAFWVGSSADLIERLGQDMPDLERTFARDGAPLGPVTRLDAILSDRHERGRGVVSLHFGDGPRLVYKPRDLGLHAGFNRFLEYCNVKGGLARLEPLRLLARDGYGYVEFVEQRPCASAEQANEFFQRAGMLLCILHVLRATDGHRENLVACGAQPVFVDVETILHPRDPAPPRDDAAAAQGVAPEERFLDSVLRTGMLPRWRFSEDQRLAYDTSALGSVAPQPVPRRVERWVNVNTDAMHLRTVSIDFPAERNVAFLHDVPLEPTRYRDAIAAGFRAMYDVVLRDRDALLAEGGPLEALRGLRGRYVPRNSQVYGSVLHQAQEPEPFRDGVAFSLALEPLARAFVLEGPSTPAPRRLLDAELRSLERQDVPLFVVDSSGTDLCSCDGLVATGFFGHSGLDDVRDQLRGLSATDRTLQLAIVEGALDALAARTDPVATPSTRDAARALSDEELLAEAIAIGDGLAARALANERGGTTWLGFGYVPEADRFQHQVLGDSLYDGTAGVALFLAALHRASGEQRFAALARDAIVDLRARARVPAAGAPVRRRALGGGIGIGSVLYASAEIARLLDDHAIAADVLALARSITEEEIAADQRLDVMSGVAGTILGLAALYRATGAPDLVDLAASCGRRLLAARVDDAWATSGTVALTGMAHGAAGIAYALLRLHALRPDAALLDAALGAMNYERRLFDPVATEWPDLRPPVGDRASARALVQWCHGAAGIGLARIGCAGLVASPAIEEEIDAAVRATSAVGLGEIDHLCCGSAGRVETLLAAAAHRGDASLRAEARARVSEIVRRARQGGGYRLFGNLDRRVWSPGLFQGTSGIGYQMLRLRGDDVRSFALWE